MAGQGDKATGKVKEMAGKVTGNEDLEAEGQDVSNRTHGPIL